MTNREYEILFQKVCQHITKGELHFAFEKLFSMTEEIPSPELREQIQNQQTNYIWMLKYAMSGINDPQQKSIFNQMQLSLLDLAEQARNAYFSKYASNIVYEQKRMGVSSVAIHTDHYESEKDLGPLFQTLWLNDRYTEEECSSLLLLLNDNNQPEADKCTFVTAVMLSLLRTFDANKFHLLLDILRCGNKMLQQRAIVALIFALSAHHALIGLNPNLLQRIRLTMEDEILAANLLNVLLQIILSNETEKISQKMTETIPTLLKEKLSNKTIFNIEELMNDTSAMMGQNPEWQSLFDKSEIGDKIKELSQLQSEGGDIFMSTFSSLKSYPFFNNIENWFLPFCNHPNAVKSNGGQDFSEAEKMVKHSIFLCNSDKYSLAFSLMQIPDNYKQLMKDTFHLEKEQMEEIQKDKALLDRFNEEKLITQQYVQDLFRFYNLHPRRRDFANPFRNLKKIHTKLFLEGNPNYEKIVRTLADYYLKRELYDEAVQLYKELEGKHANDLDILQKIAFCLQTSKQYDEALSYYQKAEVIQPENVWNLQHIAYCRKCTGDLEGSLAYYQKCAELSPEDLISQQNIGYALISLKRYAEAMKVFFKIEYLEPGNPRACKAIAWCSFVTQKLEQADRYYNKVEEAQRTDNDWMNIGHISLCEGKQEEAFYCYRQAFEKMGKEKELFISRLNEDKEHLIDNGIEKETLQLRTDYILYTICGEIQR